MCVAHIVRAFYMAEAHTCTLAIRARGRYVHGAYRTHVPITAPSGNTARFVAIAARSPLTYLPRPPSAPQNRYPSSPFASPPNHRPAAGSPQLAISL